MSYVYSPGEARFGSLCNHPVRIVLAGPAEAGSDVYVIVCGKPAEVIPGVARNVLIIWTKSWQGNYILFNMIMLL